MDREARLRLKIEGAEESLRILEQINAELDKIAARSAGGPATTVTAPGQIPQTMGAVPAGIIPANGRPAQPSVPVASIGSAATFNNAPVVSSTQVVATNGIAAALPAPAGATTVMTPANPALTGNAAPVAAGLAPPITTGIMPGGVSTRALAGFVGGQQLLSEIQRVGSATSNVYAESIRSGNPVYSERLTGSYVSAGLTVGLGVIGGATFGPAGALVGAGIGSAIGGIVDPIFQANADIAIRRRQIEAAYGPGSARGFDANQLAMAEAFRQRGLPQSRLIEDATFFDPNPNPIYYMYPGGAADMERTYLRNVNSQRFQDSFNSKESQKIFSQAAMAALSNPGNLAYETQYELDIAAGMSRQEARARFAEGVAPNNPGEAAEIYASLGENRKAAEMRALNRNRLIRQNAFENNSRVAAANQMFSPGLTSASEMSDLLWQEAQAMESEFANPSASMRARIYELRAQAASMRRSARWEDASARQGLAVGMGLMNVERRQMEGARITRQDYEGVARDQFDAASYWRGEASRLGSDDPRRSEFLLRAENYALSATRQLQSGVRSEMTSIGLESELGMNYRGTSSAMSERSLAAAREQVRLAERLTYHEQLQTQIMERKAAVQNELVRAQERIAVMGTAAAESSARATAGILGGAGGRAAGSLMDASFAASSNELATKQAEYQAMLDKGWDPNAPAMLAMRQSIAASQSALAQQKLGLLQAPLSGQDRATLAQTSLTRDLSAMGFGSPEATMAAMKTEMGILSRQLSDLNSRKEALGSNWDSGMEAAFQEQRGGIIRQMAGLQTRIDGNIIDAIVAEMAGVGSGQASLLRSRINPAAAYSEYGIETMAGGGSAASARYYRSAMGAMFGRPETAQSSQDRTINLTINVDFVDSKTGSQLQTSQVVLRDGQIAEEIFGRAFRTTPS